MKQLSTQMRQYLGMIVTKVERTVYEFEDNFYEDDGEVQIWFGDQVLRFRGASDGETIEVKITPWKDPFEGKMTPVNIEYVRSHGKWTLIDISERSGYAALIGRNLKQILPLANRFGKLIGVQIMFNDTVLNIFIHADELKITWGSQSIPRWGSEGIAE